ncbi:MAG: hypothetical protein ACE5K0_05450 [Candidatus Methanofastidiosia archaeon]
MRQRLGVGFEGTSKKGERYIKLQLNTSELLNLEPDEEDRIHLVLFPKEWSKEGKSGIYYNVVESRLKPVKDSKENES